MPEAPPTQALDYRAILREELAARCKQNPRYSLRAFARDLSLAPSRLSEILSGKQGLSRGVAIRVAAALGFAGGEAERFADLVESVHGRSRTGRDVARLRLMKHAPPTAEFQLQVDAFTAISDWYHFAILELFQVTGFRCEARWIGRRLGISEYETRLALERLLRLGLLKRNSEELELAHPDGKVFGDVPSDSIKKFHAQILQKARDGLALQPLESREYRAEILAVDRSRMNEAKQAIREFQHKFCKAMAEAEHKDGLYCLAVQFFDLGTRE